MKKIFFVLSLMVSFAYSNAHAGEIIVLGRDSVELLEVLNRCTEKFSQVMSVGHSIKSITIEKVDDSTKTYTVIVQSGGYMGGPRLHEVAALRISKVRVQDPVFIPSKPTTFNYTCDISNLVE